MRREPLRLVRLLLGLVAYSLGITLTVQANIGLSPWDVFHQGVAMRTGLTFGVASIVVAVVIVSAATIFKERIGIGTLSNMVVIGLIIDALMIGGFVPEARGLVPGIFMMVCGLFVIALAMVLYMGAGYGAGPRDSLMVLLSKRTGKSAGLCRGIVEAIALVIGWLLGGRVGVGTIISAACIGVAVQIVFAALRFDVRAIRHETLGETFRRLKGFSEKKSAYYGK